VKKVAFIGQAPPKTNADRPFGRSALYKWFSSIGVTDEYISKYFYFGALIDFFPGVDKRKSHLVPTRSQIDAYKSTLRSELVDFKADIIVPIGKLSIVECISEDKYSELGSTLSNVIGRKFNLDPYNLLDRKLPIIPFPHPSGASTWIYMPGNDILLMNALNLLQKELNIDGLANIL
jgi:uracil-DNA glycosylase